MLVSIIIPTLNEEGSINRLLQQLQMYRQQGHEVIIVDGGSKENTCSISKKLSDKLIESNPGRAAQMNAGAEEASNNILWFLHADTFLPENAIEPIQKILIHYDWGRFNIKLSGSNSLFRIIEKMINLRSCFVGIATGDQGIFVKRETFKRVNGYSILPLMEDVDLSKKLKIISKPACLKERLITSSRRWERNGILSTVFLMWRLRFLFWIGVSADKLAVQYRT